MECFQNSVCAPHENARVPIKLIALHKNLGKFFGWLFYESLYLVKVSIFFIVYLDVSISRFRTMWLYAYGYQFVGMCGKIQPFFMASLNSSNFNMR